MERDSFQVHLCFLVLINLSFLCPLATAEQRIHPTSEALNYSSWFSDDATGAIMCSRLNSAVFYKSLRQVTQASRWVISGAEAWCSAMEWVKVLLDVKTWSTNPNPNTKTTHLLSVQRVSKVHKGAPLVDSLSNHVSAALRWTMTAYQIWSSANFGTPMCVVWMFF